MIVCINYLFLDFFENSDGNYSDESCSIFFRILNEYQGIKECREEMYEFLKILNGIGSHHYRDRQFNSKMKQILLHYKEQINQTLSNDEIFHIFEHNKNIVHFLLKNEIITISDHIYKSMMSKFESNGVYYWHFFIPELGEKISKEKMSFVKKAFLALSKYFNI